MLDHVSGVVADHALCACYGTEPLGKNLHRSAARAQFDVKLSGLSTQVLRWPLPKPQRTNTVSSCTHAHTSKCKPYSYTLCPSPFPHGPYCLPFSASLCYC